MSRRTASIGPSWTGCSASARMRTIDTGTTALVMITSSGFAMTRYWTLSGGNGQKLSQCTGCRLPRQPPKKEPKWVLRAGFASEVLTAAILDRLLHHGTVVNIRGQSYRLKEKLRGGILESGEPAETRPSRRQKPTGDQA